MNKISYNFAFTLSKSMAILILLLGFVYSIYTKDNSVLTNAILVSGGLMGFKTGAEAFVRNSVTTNPNTYTNITPNISSNVHPEKTVSICNTNCKE